jgi:transposase-like protein
MARSRPIAHSAESDFHPPHCPNSACTHYIPRPDWRPARDGFFRRPSDGRRFQRFRCTHCSRRFSTRTFAADYWLKRRDALLEIARLSTEGPGLRQIARILGLSHTTVMRHVARAGRHCMLFHRRMLSSSSSTRSLVIDGFESFEFSQFFPFHFNLAVDAASWLILHFTDSPLRRKGTMTPAQWIRRMHLEARLGRPDPKAVEQGIFELLLSVLQDSRFPKDSEMLILSDDHPAYRRALRRLRRHVGLPHLRQQVTPSTLRRTTTNPLFPVNLTDLLLRHAQANHRRETIAFSKRRQAALERLAVFTVWRNAIKNRRENEPGETAAMAAGLLQRPLEWAEVLAKRMFPRREVLPGSWWSYYWGRVRTAALGLRQRRHQLQYAF